MYLKQLDPALLVLMKSALFSQRSANFHFHPLVHGVEIRGHVLELTFVSLSKTRARKVHLGHTLFSHGVMKL